MKTLITLILILGSLIGFSSIGKAQVKDAPVKDTVKSEVLMGQSYTKEEYKQVAIDITTKFSKRETKSIDYNDFQLWIATVNKETGKCQFVLRDVNEKNLYDKLNAKIVEECLIKY